MGQPPSGTQKLKMRPPHIYAHDETYAYSPFHSMRVEKLSPDCFSTIRSVADIVNNCTHTHTHTHNYTIYHRGGLVRVCVRGGILRNVHPWPSHSLPQITIMELNPIFTMMLFPLGGGGKQESHAHFFTDDLHNPAVIRGVMRDAFMYVKKYHGVKVSYSDPNIHIEPKLQMMIGTSASNNQKLHWSWETFNRLLHQEAKNAEAAGSEAETEAEVAERLQKATANPGREFLTLLIHEQQRLSE